MSGTTVYISNNGETSSYGGSFNVTVNYADTAPSHQVPAYSNFPTPSPTSNPMGQYLVTSCAAFTAFGATFDAWEGFSTCSLALVAGNTYIISAMFPYGINSDSLEGSGDLQLILVDAAGFTLATSSEDYPQITYQCKASGMYSLQEGCYGNTGACGGTVRGKAMETLAK